MRSEKYINRFLESLDNKLKENGINNFIYSLGKKKEDTTCLKFEQDKWLIEKEEEKIICDKIEKASKVFASEISFSDEEKNIICSTIGKEYKKIAELKAKPQMTQAEMAYLNSLQKTSALRKTKRLSLCMLRFAFKETGWHTKCHPVK